ncbi:hypothetical protein [Pseudonocardia broussonetiae]|uniref:DUF2269 domain-containing protein n=1 Tax=Pseudonocardia broussonetiae TaxID=2736640 RepID=A0A6M6JH98_9PSEU|nr:hypothetical protein [Pseudonocardia broussonetiae]QJY47398.1 hypothetical protein HOP40_17585 [Pseudonocardia broussonetiae]
MSMRGPVRKAALLVHVSCSVGWIGAVAAFLVLAVAGVGASDEVVVRSSYVGMDLVARFAVVPLALASLLTGLVQALGTEWGLIRHYWVVVKLAVTVVAVAVLLLQMESIGYLADVSARSAGAEGLLGEARMSLVVHAGGGLVVLLVPLALSIFKPRGPTGFGRGAGRPTNGPSRGRRGEAG